MKKAILLSALLVSAHVLFAQRWGWGYGHHPHRPVVCVAPRPVQVVGYGYGYGGYGMYPRPGLQVVINATPRVVVAQPPIVVTQPTQVKQWVEAHWEDTPQGRVWVEGHYIIREG